MILNVENDLDLEEIKIALKIDTDDDDIEVKRAVMAATAYIKGAIGSGKPSFYLQKNETMELINLSIIMFSDHYYKSRSATIESVTANGTLREYDLGFTSIILQLKGKYALFEENDTDAVSRTGKLKHRVSFKRRNGFEIGVNGIKIPKYEQVTKSWFAYKQKFISEIKSEDEAYVDTIDIIIRQQQKEVIRMDYIAEINNKEYNIIKMNPDLTDRDFMLLILKAVN